MIFSLIFMLVFIFIIILVILTFQCCGNSLFIVFFLMVCNLAQVVRKPVSANPGLKAKRSNIFGVGTFR